MHKEQMYSACQIFLKKKLLQYLLDTDAKAFSIPWTSLSQGPCGILADHKLGKILGRFGC